MTNINMVVITDTISFEGGTIRVWK